MDYIKKESLDDANFTEVSQIFWQKKGLIHLFNLPENIRLKQLKVEIQARKKLDDLRIKNDRDLLYSILPKVVEEAKKHHLKKLSESDTEVFLIDDQVILPRRLLRMLRSLVNLKLK